MWDSHPPSSAMKPRRLYSFGFSCVFNGIEYLNNGGKDTNMISRIGDKDIKSSWYNYIRYYQFFILFYFSFSFRLCLQVLVILIRIPSSGKICMYFRGIMVVKNINI